MEFEDDADALRAALSEDDAGRTPSEIAAAAGHATAALLARAEAGWSRGARARSGGRCGGARRRSRAFWSVSRRCAFLR